MSKKQQKKSVIEEIKSGIKKFFDDPIQVIDMIKDMFSNEPKSLNDIARLYSKASDEIIIKTLEKEKFKYGGGKFHIKNLENNKEIEVSIELYFQDDNDNWIKKENKDLISADEFTEEALEELKKKKEITYNIEEPSLEENDDLKDIFSDNQSRIYFLEGLIYLAKANKEVETEEYNLFLRFAEILNIKEEEKNKLINHLKNKEKEVLDLKFENKKQAKTLILKSLQLALIDGTYDKEEKEALLSMNKYFGLSESYFRNIEKKAKNMDWVINEGEINL